ncbi:MAG: response regulator transcription factor [Bacteroidales bacterium]|nr:response regulator transcription factor [Bacteroidales bacterium]MCF8388281.1 response regulator transcription factor [Bacteroidales bacterium]MCF8397425.1 response regulator transcription factor [Bacteroidales bacterium]
MSNYNIIMAEKSYLVRLGIMQVLEELKVQATISECSNIKEVKHRLKSMDVDVMIMNAAFKDISASEIIQLKSDHPGLKVAQIINSEEEAIPVVDHIINLNEDKRKVFQKIEAIFKSAQRPKHEASESGLSKREIEILRLVARGLTNSEIAEKLFISTHTVISHRKNISHKLGIKSVAGLTVYAVLNNYIDGSSIR